MNEKDPLETFESIQLGSGREDTSNAERFVQMHEDCVRFWHGRNRWMWWTSTNWSDDQESAVVELAKITAKFIYVEASELPDDDAKKMARWAEKSLSREKIKSMLFLAQSDPRVSTTTKTWDQDPWALNFQNGTVDLRTGELRAHRKEDFLTKIVKCNYVPGLAGPRWSKFVAETFGQLQDFIQKAVGYSLTGMTSEKVVFLLHGLTDTGKSTFLSTLRELLADYSSVLQVETLMWSRNTDNNVAADLADLRGARLVITSETEEGQRLREARLKRLTQGTGEIKTARKYENPIVFPETHKLWLDCNHQPRITGTDDAIWNRLIPIPCLHRVRESEKDRNLKDKLLAEGSAIASWIVAGALRWQEEGLGRPLLVQRTCDEWRKSADIIGQFIEECCVTGDERSVRACRLYDEFVAWSRKQGHEHILTSTAFGLRLVERPMITKSRGAAGLVYHGIDLESLS